MSLFFCVFLYFLVYLDPFLIISQNYISPYQSGSTVRLQRFNANKNQPNLHVVNYKQSHLERIPERILINNEESPLFNALLLFSH